LNQESHVFDPMKLMSVRPFALLRLLLKQMPHTCRIRMYQDETTGYKL